MVEDGIEINKATPRPYIGMPIEIDDNCEETKPSDTYCESWSLAMAYVPWQSWDATYEPDEGFIEGTIFPCLNLPFLGGRCK